MRPLLVCRLQTTRTSRTKLEHRQNDLAQILSASEDVSRANNRTKALADTRGADRMTRDLDRRPPEPPIGDEWELISKATDSITMRLEVPGGWIYRSIRVPTGDEGNCTESSVFVPFPTASQERA